jgi:hypothetical protein
LVVQDLDSPLVHNRIQTIFDGLFPDCQMLVSLYLSIYICNI